MFSVNYQKRVCCHLDVNHLSKLLGHVSQENLKSDSSLPIIFQQTHTRTYSAAGGSTSHSVWDLTSCVKMKFSEIKSVLIAPSV